MPAPARMQGSRRRRSESPRIRQTRDARRRRPSAADADGLGVALCDELGCHAGADSAVTKVLADRLTCDAQQALRRCRSHSPSGHQPTPANLFRHGRPATATKRPIAELPASASSRRSESRPRAGRPARPSDRASTALLFGDQSGQAVRGGCHSRVTGIGHFGSRRDGARRVRLAPRSLLPLNAWSGSVGRVGALHAQGDSASPAGGRRLERLYWPEESRRGG